MTNKQLYEELSSYLTKLIDTKKYHFSISYNSAYNGCRTFISIYIHHYDEVIKSYWISIKDSNFNNKFKEIKNYIDDLLNKQKTRY